MRIQELAAVLNSEVEGPAGGALTRVSSLESAGPGEVAFVSAGPKSAAAAVQSAAGCLLVPLDFDNSSKRTVIRVPDPRAAIAIAIQKLYPTPRPEPGVHPTAILAEGVELGEGVSIGPMVIIGEDTRIGAGTIVGTGSIIADHVQIGARCLLHPRVTIYREVLIGNECVLHSGAVIGADGFGFVMVKDASGGRYEKFPQVGRVEIANNVEVGANACVDRAALGVTSIGEGTKLDNMVHIAHNCKIGKHVVIAAQTGISGGAEVGDYAVIAGQVGIADKVKIESRAVLGAQCGVPSSKIIRAGQVVWGTPARPIKDHLAQLAELARITKKRSRGAKNDD